MGLANKGGQDGLLGQVLGGYRLERVLGRGGMGRVYLGTHTTLGRKAAVKVLEPSLAADDSYVRRFFNEAKVVSDIGHTNIVDVTDFVRVESPAIVAIVMEYIDGPSLTQGLRTKVIGPGDAIEVSVQIGRALEAAHRAGVVHRDLKPDNILLRVNDHGLHVKLVDFGIAKVKTADFKTATGALIGTPVYMAPEQAIAADVSGATDVCAAAEVLFEILAGPRLFGGEISDVMRAKVQGTQPSLELPAGTPNAPDFVELLRECLDIDPAKRPSATDFVRRLIQIREGPARTRPSHPEPTEPTVAPVAPVAPLAEFVLPTQPGSSTSSPLPPGRRSTGLVLGSIAGAVGVFWFFGRGPGPEIVPVDAGVLAAREAPLVSAPVSGASDAGTTRRGRVTSSPPGADVFDGSGRLIGLTPFEVELRPGETHRLTIRMLGHSARTVELSAAAPAVEVSFGRSRGLVAKVSDAAVTAPAERVEAAVPATDAPVGEPAEHPHAGVPDTGVLSEQPVTREAPGDAGSTEVRNIDKRRTTKF
ncbi:MAG: protein kinase [Deltaproteobacteria bacterium]|nr:protein kinase [Deltaproteobacteria bacterium]